MEDLDLHMTVVCEIGLNDRRNFPNILHPEFSDRVKQAGTQGIGRTTACPEPDVISILGFVRVICRADENGVPGHRELFAGRKRQAAVFVGRILCGWKGIASHTEIDWNERVSL